MRYCPTRSTVWGWPKRRSKAIGRSSQEKASEDPARSRTCPCTTHPFCVQYGLDQASSCRRKGNYQWYCCRASRTRSLWPHLRQGRVTCRSTPALLMCGDKPACLSKRGQLFVCVATRTRARTEVPVYIHSCCPWLLAESISPAEKQG